MPEGVFSAARPYPAGHPQTRSGSLARVDPASRVEPYLSQPGVLDSGCRHRSQGPVVKAGRHVRSPTASASGPYPHIGSGLVPDRRRSSSCVRPSMSPPPQPKAFLPAPAYARSRPCAAAAPHPSSSVRQRPSAVRTLFIGFARPARAIGHGERNFAETGVSA